MDSITILSRLKQLRESIYDNPIQIDNHNTKKLDPLTHKDFLELCLDKFNLDKPIVTKENDSKLNYFIEKLLLKENLDNLNKCKIALILKKVLGYDFNANIKSSDYINKKRLYNIVTLLNRYPSLSEKVLIKEKKIDKGFIKIYNSLKIIKPSKFLKQIENQLEIN